MSAKDAKYYLGGLVDIAGAESVTVEKQGRAVSEVLAVDEYEGLRKVDARSAANLAIQGLDNV